MGPVFVLIDSVVFGFALAKLKSVIGQFDNFFMFLHYMLMVFLMLSLGFSIGALYSENFIIFSTIYLVCDFVSMLSFILILKMVNGDTADSLNN
jgi:hypothetical protein